MEKPIIPIEEINQAIFEVRGQRVILDFDLAKFYGVETKRLNEQVKRNKDRFPYDFMFQLTSEEWDILRSQNATANEISKRRTLPYAFTEHGALMASSVLKTEQATQMSVFIIRAFVRLRQLVNQHNELKKKVQKLELQFQLQDGKVGKHTQQIQILFEAVKKLLDQPPQPKPKQIGYKENKDKP